MANIKFGTDGWRAITGEDFNTENVSLVTNAIAKYVFDNFGLKKKIIIGYDPRNQADVLSKLCADILVQKGLSLNDDKALSFKFSIKLPNQFVCL